MSRQDAVAWLNQALGPNTVLVYPVHERARIRDHLIDLIQEFPTLRVQTQHYTHTNGSVVELLMAEGTLPMYYSGVKYNIPVQLWLSEHFPHRAPIVYVVPTPDMIIKPRHSFVDASGIVSTPYILQWGRSSNLVDLCQDTMMSFGHDPPLYSKGPGYTEPPRARPPPAASPSFQANNPIHQPSPSPPPYMQGPMAMNNMNGRPPPPPSHTSSGNIWGGAVAAMNQQQGSGHEPPPGRTSSSSPMAQRPPQPPPQQQQQPPQANLKETFTVAAREALTTRLQGSLTAANASAAAGLDKQLETQGKLQARARALSQGVSSLTNERVALEQSVAELNGKAIAMERWLADNEAKVPTGEVDADTAIVAADVLSRQALDAQAEDLALEDTMYELDKTLQESNQPADAYLKQIRTLCRRQFFVRALGNKVAGCQHTHRQRGSSSGGGGGFGAPTAATSQHVQMPQGDSWSNTGILTAQGGAPYSTGILSNPLAARR
ncbi:hypothetical protein WJX73_002163 [Symbiochloris irregularis]|uniref:UEV domain-containing protein n=1 Tax=Symbiochloris irregularis TaxID=706552 RepID=A0AAW1NMW2_9CHLO